MKMIADIARMQGNISKAHELVGKDISLMMKDFYDDIYEHLGVEAKVFAKRIERSVYPTIGGEKYYHSGTFAVSKSDVKEAFDSHQDVYIPINLNDDREGLSACEVFDLVEYANNINKSLRKIYISVTTGCINNNQPEKTFRELCSLCDLMPSCVTGVSVGGSYYLQYNGIGSERLPDRVSDVRIGEYMLYGTIPYCDRVEIFGENALSVEMKVVGVRRDRQHIIVSGGYSQIDTKDSPLLSGGLEFVDSSSDYTIYRDRFNRYKEGDTIEVVPSYKSLVKLKYVEREYKK